MFRAVTQIAIFLGIVGSASAASAQERFVFYRGVREAAMGGVYSGVVNDETAVLLNPAGLGKLRDTTVTVIDPELEGSFNDTQVATLSNAMSVLNAQGLLSALKSSPGTYFDAKVQVFPSIVTTNFGFGLHAKYQYDAYVDSTSTNFHFDYRNDFAPAFGYCFRFFGGILKIGVSARVIDRTEISTIQPASSTNLSSDSLQKEGLGVGGDAGLILTSPTAWLPTISGVVHDIGDTSYALSNGVFHSTSSRPSDTLQTIDAGFSVFPILSNQNRMSISVDYDDVTNVEATSDPMKRLHGGLEFNIHDFLFIRGGWNERYWTAGLELASERFQIQLASYGEEVGTYPTTTEDRRWVGKFAFRF